MMNVNVSECIVIGFCCYCRVLYIVLNFFDNYYFGKKEILFFFFLLWFEIM